MKDIPIFDTDTGVSTLVLKEIPYKQVAYVTVRSVQPDGLRAHLEECVRFCRMCGAERVYASDGKNDLPGEHAYDMIMLTVQRSNLPPVTNPVELEQVTAANGEEYLSVYNECFRDLPGAASYGKKDLGRLIDHGSGFLTRKNGVCAGVAELENDELAGICVLPEFRGLGYDLALTALQRLEAPVVQLKTASTNEKALSLYRRLGFGNDTVISRWWLIR